MVRLSADYRFFFKPMLDDLSGLGSIADLTRPQVTAFGGATTLYTVAAFATPVGYLIDKCQSTL